MTRTRALIPRARALRRHATAEERLLWNLFLRDCEPRVKRQRPFEGYILDFYVPKLRLCIELDGAQHHTPEGIAYDLERSTLLEAHGLTVVRFTNLEVRRNLAGVCERLERLGLHRILE